MRGTFRVGCVLLAVLFGVLTAGQATAVPRTGAHAGVVLAMGDSYNIGAPYPGQLTNPFGCARQGAQPGALVAAKKGYEYRSVACGGAKVSNIVQLGQWFEPRQLDAVTRNVDVVILSIGGNDGAGPASLAACILPMECTRNNPIVQRGFAGIDGLWNPVTHTGSLGAVYAAIKSRLKPGARVLVSGYGVYVAELMAPYEFPACKELVSVGERKLVNEVVFRLNAAIRAAAQHYGLTYVDQSAGLSLGAGLCSAYGTPGKTIAALNGPIPLHPTYEGVVSQADHYLRALG